MTPEYNLLFGVFAVQLNTVTPDKLIEAAAAWALNPATDLPQRLEELKAISPTDRVLIQRLVDEAIASHEGNASKTLGTFGGAEQVHRTFRGSIVLTADGQVSIPSPTATTRDGDPFLAYNESLNSVKGVTETPGRYTSISEHARGGMGRVLLVHDDHLGREIALKELLPRLGTSDPDAPEADNPSPVRFSAQILGRFLQEARITGQLEHPSIVPVYELGHRADGSLYYTMKLVRGKSLSKAIRECRSLEERLRLLPHFVDLCQAIAYAHSRHVIHRDIKPANVMVGEFGETVVLDWGLAKKRDRVDVHLDGLAETIHYLNAGNEDAAAQTAYGQILGTPVYMAPEQAKGQLADVDEQSDVYALGVVLYEILTGTVPFKGKNTRDLLQKVVAGNYPPVRECEANAPPELVAIAEKAMQAEKKHRYVDALAVADEVERFLTGGAVHAYDYSIAHLIRRFYSRHKTAVLTATAAALVLLLSLAYFNWRLYQSRDSEREQRLAAEAANRDLENEAYASNILVAQKYINEDNVERALTYLELCPPEKRNWEWFHLQRNCRPFFDQAHHDPAWAGSDHPYRCEFNASAQLVLSQWNFGGLVTVYNRTTRTFDFVSKIDTFLGWPYATHFGPEPGHITVGTDETHVVYLDYQSNTVIREFAIEDGWLSSFRISDDARYAAGYRFVEESGVRELVVWNFQTGEILNTVALRPTPPGIYAYIPQDQRDFRIPAEHPFGIVAGFIAGTHTIVLTDDDLCTYDIDTDTLKRHRPCGDGIAALHPDMPVAACYVPGSQDIDVIDLVNGTTTRITNTRDIAQLTVGSRNPVLVAAGHFDQFWTIWNGESGDIRAQYRLDTSNFQSSDIARDKPLGVTLCSRQDLEFWHLESPIIEKTVSIYGVADDRPGHRFKDTWYRPFRRWALRPDRAQLILVPDHETAVVYNVPGFDVIYRWKPHDGRIRDMAYSDDGTLFATAGWDGYARVWRVADASLLMEVHAPIDEACFGADLSPDNAELAVAYGERSTVDRGQNPVIIYDIPSGTEKRRIDIKGGRANAVRYSPDGQTLHIGRWGTPFTDQISFLNVQTNGLSAPEPGVTGISWGDTVIYSPCSRWVIFHGELGDPVLAERATGKILYRIARTDAFSVNFSPDGERFVTAENAKERLTIYRSQGEGALATFDDALAPAFFSADGNELYALTPGGGLRVLYGGERIQP